VIHLDTSFLIDLHREIARGRAGPALDLVEALDEDEILAASVFVVCELEAGAGLARDPAREHRAVDELLAGLLVVHPDGRLPGTYARLYRASLRNGRPVAAMDLLIGSAAILDDAPLITRNVTHFSRIPGLRLRAY
jgi:predicted nucleic acid-binding protein